MPFLVSIDGAIVEWGQTFSAMRFTYRNTSFPFPVDNGWTFSSTDSAGQLTEWVYYTNVQDVSGGSALKAESRPIIGSDGFYYSTIFDPSASTENFYYFDSTYIFEGDRTDLQTISVNFLRPLEVDTTFYINISDGKVAPDSSIYPNTWLSLLQQSITVPAGETSFLFQ
jgi:hypothetical protein